MLAVLCLFLFYIRVVCCSLCLMLTCCCFCVAAVVAVVLRRVPVFVFVGLALLLFVVLRSAVLPLLVGSASLHCVF